MKKALLAIILIVVALVSLPLMADEKAGPDTFFVLSRLHNPEGSGPSRVFAVDPQSGTTAEIASDSREVFVRQVMVPGESSKSILYSLGADGAQTVAVFDRSSHEVTRFDAGYVPPFMLKKGSFWSFHENRIFFFGNFDQNGMVSSYDWKTNNAASARLDKPILDAATDGSGTLYLGEPGKIIRQYSLPDLKRIASISHERDFWGLARIGHEVALLERKPVHGTRDCFGYVTRFGKNLTPKEEVKLGLCSGFGWQGETGVLIVQTESFLSVKSKITLIGENGKKLSLPISRGFRWQLDPSNGFIYGANSGALVRVNLSDFSTVSFKANIRASRDLIPSYGGENVVLQRRGSRTASIIDFEAKASIMIDVERRKGSVVYLPAAKRVVVLEPRSGRILCFAFPGGEQVGVIDGIQDGVLLLPCGDGRKAVLVSRGAWQVLDGSSLTMTGALGESAESPTPADETSTLYSVPDGASSGRLMVLRSDGAWVVSLPDLKSFWIPCAWGAGAKETADTQLVGESRSSL